MRLQLVAARQGALWVRQGFRIFLSRALGFTGLFILFMLTAQLLMLLGTVGALIAFALMPLVSLGFMVATQQALQNRFPGPSAFIEALRAGPVQRRAHLKLGLAYAVALTIVFWIGDVVGGDAFQAVQQAVADGKTSPEELEPLLTDPRLRWGMLLTLAGIAALSLPFWHAPALVHWGGQPWGKALFFSTMAWWRNKGALAVYALTWFGATMLFGMAASLLMALLGTPQLMVLLLTPAMLMISAAFYASLYFTFADCFEPSAETPPPQLESP
ncbi:BPSS1780 family membrane protein [Piscinibacter sp.]|uniref:BPSS1780 family membrane protein n=1 Tax=Piscinibacter sp. TaxID=1903157 RepID=UPI002C4A6532|nr:BPSS1780 family membrane protein [Albitalea sp.]HUG24098.1 BPSS1780 family membrane protein [Albitalea sp.]